MTRTSKTRSALFTSIISLLLCVSMLVGTTFAWFTDEVVSGRNVIAAGNLDVELYYSKTTDFTDEKKVDSQTILFTDKYGNEIKYWEPGVVAYSNLQVANVGTLALTYRMTLNFDIKNYVEYEDGSKYDLSNVLKVAIVEGGFVGERADAHALAYDYNLESFSISGELEADQKTKTYGVVIYWEPGSNEYDNLFNMNNGKQTSDKQPLSVELGINLFATQEEYEQDSFDENYDETADHIIAAGEVVRFVNEELNGYYLNNGTLYITDGSTLTNDGRGLTTTGDASLSDVVVKAGTAGTYAMVAEGKDATLTLDNVTLNSGGGAIGAVDGATVIINSGSIDVDSTSTSGRYHIYAEGEGSTVIVNGGNFDFNKTQNQKRAYVYAGTGTTVIINGGNFGKASARSGYTAGILGEGEVIIKGGTFKFDPSNWVALGYEVTKEGDTWTVSAIPAVKDTDALAAAINDNQSTIVLGEGTFHMPAAAKGKNLTIIGAGKDTVIEIVPAGQGEANGQLDYNLDSSTVAFNNLTIKTNNQTYAGYARLNATYNNCVFENCYCLNGTSTFTDCTFNVSGDQYNIWTWGAPEATFNGCTFNSDGKAVLLYGTADTKLTLNNCVFNDTGVLPDLKAAVEIGNDYGKSYELTVNNTTVNGYEINDKGIYTGTTLWGNKNSMSSENLSVIVDGVTQVWDANGLAKALTSDAKNISAKLVNDIELPISSLGTITGGSGEYKLAGEATETITLDLNNNKLNITTTYWSAIGANNDNATITVKNGSMTSTGNSDGTWNAWDLRFSNCNWNFENVDFLKAVALDNAGKVTNMKNVTITDSHDVDTYALWITTEGQTVNIDGLTIDMLAATDGRGIKIDDQYVDASSKVYLNVSNATFKTEEKAAILVKSPAGADITLSNVNITDVDADKTNAVWVDSDAAAYADLVTVSGGTVIDEP